MGTLTVIVVLPSKLNLQPFPLSQEKSSFFMHRARRRRSLTKKSQSIVPVARLFGPAIFEASKLKVLFLGVDEKKHPGKLPRTYTLTHSDITSKLTLAISQTINNSQLQGWYNRLQRDEVVAEWKKIKGKMSLHVHCHISGGHFLLDLCARLRFYIFCKELPVVLKAFVHGDESLLSNYPELQDALVWVYFHSNIPEFNKVECWGPLKVAGCPSIGTHNERGTLLVNNANSNSQVELGLGMGLGLDTPRPCQESCTCCFPPISLIPWTQNLHTDDGSDGSDGRISSVGIGIGIEQQNIVSGES